MLRSKHLFSGISGARVLDDMRQSRLGLKQDMREVRRREHADATVEEYSERLSLVYPTDHALSAYVAGFYNAD
eukprot:2740302-Pyramimonas_sp.AAC.1